MPKTNDPSATTTLKLLKPVLEALPTLEQIDCEFRRAQEDHQSWLSRRSPSFRRFRARSLSTWKRSSRSQESSPRVKSRFFESLESAPALHVTFSVFVIVVEIDVSTPAQLAISNAGDRST